MNLAKLCIFTFFIHSLYASNWHHEEPKRTLPAHPYLQRSTGRARQAAPMNRQRVIQNRPQEQHYTIERRQGSCGSISSLDATKNSTEPCPKEE